MLDSNLKYLQPSSAKQLSDFKITRRIRVLEAKSGAVTLKVTRAGEQEVFLHSAYHPEREAERFIQGQDLAQADTILLIGFGLGYHVQAVINNLDKGQKLKIIIVNPDVFKVAVATRKLTGIFTDERVEIILEINPDNLIKRLELLFKDLAGLNNQLIIHNQSINTVSDKYLFLKDILEEIKISRYNSKRLNKNITNNIKKNIKLINDCVGVSKFKDIFKDIPIFIISAGPSLDKNIEDLNAIEDRGILIVVDTALPLLINLGIRPDFIVTTEPIDFIYDKVFKNYPNLDIPLLHSLAASHQLINNYTGRKIIGLSKKDLFMDKLATVVKKGRILTGGTVALPAMDFASLMGGNPIVFVGQDFAFADDGRTHASNTFYQNRKLDTAFLKKIPGVNGNIVCTSTNYYLYLKSFEKYISDNPGNYIDATEGGAIIKGAKIMKLKEVINYYCNSSVKKIDLVNRIFDSKDRVKTPVNELKTLLEEGL